MRSELRGQSSEVGLRKLTETEIDALLDRFIAKYLNLVGPIADEAKQIALAHVTRFLHAADTNDFKSADEFADAVIEEIKVAYQGSFATARAEAIVRRTTKDIYTFYRLRDASPFGNAAKPTLKFGGPDTRAVRFFNDVDHWYLSGIIDNRRPELQNFLRDEYLAKGAALFGRETTESINNFRLAAAGKLDNLNDYGVRTIITSSVQRIRNYAHINALRQGRFKWAHIIAILDAKTSDICRFLDGKFIRAGVAAETVDRLTKLEPGDYALEMYKSELGRSYSSDSVNYVKDRVGSNGVIADSLVAEGRGFPPYHPNCRTRVEGVEEALGDAVPTEE